jgi:uncharacterized protein YcfL
MKNKIDGFSLGKTAIKRALSLSIGIGCTVGGLTAQAVDVKVMFDSAACPIGVSAEEVTISKSAAEKVNWASYNEDGTQPLPISYQIFFDPFKGKSMVSDRNGQIESQPVDREVPEDVVFKYTVYNPACPNGPLDPQIRVRR